LYEAQCGFRKGRGVDDVLQVSRRIVEEAVRCKDQGEVVLLRLFDIEKAYPRVSKDTLWKLMTIKGAPQNSLMFAKDYTNTPNMQQQKHGGMSKAYNPDKGLREGCPSSPRCLTFTTMQ
jgi:hypothetical protein